MLTPIQRLVAILISVGIVVGGAIACTHTPESQSTTTSNTTSATSTEDTKLKKETARNTIYQILAASDVKYDKVDHEYKFSSQNWANKNIGWNITVDSSGRLIGPFVSLVTHQPLATSSDWIFWDKLTFSSSTGKFAYEMKETFAGQTGGGKGTKITDAGTFEYGIFTIDNIHQGLTILTTGTDPIIRFKGERIYDYELTEEDVTNLKNALALFDARNIDNQLDFAKIQEIANK